jgi:CubicO group peptidase (beta-lactamase class C family)
MRKTLFLTCLLLGALCARADVKPEAFAKCDAAINQAVAEKKCPGAVLLVGVGDQTVYLKAYGHRAVEPEPVDMTTDTIFDLASLSKTVGTAPSIMILADRGKLNVHDKITKYIPSFGQNGKEDITIEDLLLHHSGLIPDNPESEYDKGAEAAYAKIDALTPKWKPRTHFAYSDVNYIMLGRIVKVVSGQPLDQFAAENLFKPLGMHDTTYNPPASWRPRIAPTQQRNGHWMIGEVHDPRSYALGGVAGHAGLFSTAEDLSRFIRMILHKGELDGHRVLSEAAVKEWTTVHTVPADERTPDRKASRTYGFDVDTGYSGPRGERFARGKTFGHTGFTGTAFWIDPENSCYYILLTNSVHPNGKGNVLRLRREVGTDVAEAILGDSNSSR